MRKTVVVFSISQNPKQMHIIVMCVNCSKCDYFPPKCISHSTQSNYYFLLKALTLDICICIMAGQNGRKGEDVNNDVVKTLITVVMGRI